MRFSVKQLAVAAIAILLVLPAMSWAGSNYSTVNKSIRVESGTNAGEVDSVNGSIRIGSDSVVKSVESVNGAIDIGDGVNVERDIEAVNGSVELGRGSEVGGNIETVNGAIRMKNTNVAGDIETINGGIKLLDGTVVEGSIKVREPKGWSSNRRKPVKVEIGEDVRVYGDLIFEQPVELKIHNSANVGEVIGEEVTVIEG